MTAEEHQLLAVRLGVAADSMAARYGLTCMEIAYARPGTDAHALAHRKASRQYRALMRLTAALTNLALTGVTL
ncbi:hypothetical protein [Micromonospora sp. DT62]|uniref:hypothetical protein n=1 Tax=Micromonospora sp. DT62 TaxID=3416521 RepID=UPI003CE7FB3A